MISGDFFGWNFGLASGGFGGLLIATGIVAIIVSDAIFAVLLEAIGI